MRPAPATYLSVTTKVSNATLLSVLTVAASMCAVMAAVSGAPVAQAASARELLAGAIANTRGSYLVYNFGFTNFMMNSLPAA